MQNLSELVELAECQMDQVLSLPHWYPALMRQTDLSPAKNIFHRYIQQWFQISVIINLFEDLRKKLEVIRIAQQFTTCCADVDEYDV